MMNEIKERYKYFTDRFDKFNFTEVDGLTIPVRLRMMALDSAINYFKDSSQKCNSKELVEAANEFKDYFLEGYGEDGKYIMEKPINSLDEMEKWNLNNCKNKDFSANYVATKLRWILPDMINRNDFEKNPKLDFSFPPNTAGEVKGREEWHNGLSIHKDKYEELMEHDNSLYFIWTPGIVKVEFNPIRGIKSNPFLYLWDLKAVPEPEWTIKKGPVSTKNLKTKFYTRKNTYGFLRNEDALDISKLLLVKSLF